jgi:hypothetical protein
LYATSTAPSPASADAQGKRGRGDGGRWHHAKVADELPVYEERRGWTARTIRAVAVVSLLDIALGALFVIARRWLGVDHSNICAH